MHLKAWRFASLMLAAVVTGLGLCHLMEMPARMTWYQHLWVGSTVHGGLYRMFGTAGTVFVIANIVCGCVVTWMVRHRERRVFRLTLFGASVFVVTLVLWFAFVAPVNTQLALWLTGPVPADWANWRAQWEGAHAFNAVLQLFGFAALAWSVVTETPGEQSETFGASRAQVSPG